MPSPPEWTTSCMPAIIIFLIISFLWFSYASRLLFWLFSCFDTLHFLFLDAFFAATLFDSLCFIIAADISSRHAHDAFAFLFFLFMLSLSLCFSRCLLISSLLISRHDFRRCWYFHLLYHADAAFFADLFSFHATLIFLLFRYFAADIWFLSLFHWCLFSWFSFWCHYLRFLFDIDYLLFSFLSAFIFSLLLSFDATPLSLRLMLFRFYFFHYWFTFHWCLPPLSLALPFFWFSSFAIFAISDADISPCDFFRRHYFLMIIWWCHFADAAIFCWLSYFLAFFFAFIFAMRFSPFISIFDGIHAFAIDCCYFRRFMLMLFLAIFIYWCAPFSLYCRLIISPLIFRCHWCRWYLPLMLYFAFRLLILIFFWDDADFAIRCHYCFHDFRHWYFAAFHVIFAYFHWCHYFLSCFSPLPPSFFLSLSCRLIYAMIFRWLSLFIFYAFYFIWDAIDIFAFIFFHWY